MRKNYFYTKNSNFTRKIIAQKKDLNSIKCAI